MEIEERYGYASSYKQLYNSLILFNKHLDIYFSNMVWLKRYESWMKGKDLTVNTMGIRFRTLRGIYNDALEDKVVKCEHYPFKEFKVARLHEDTVKRAITKNKSKEVIVYQKREETFYRKLAVDIYVFSYFMGGINFTDVARLTDKNIVEGRLIYLRKKTKKLIKLPVQPIVLNIIEKYRSENNSYLFPVLSSFHKTEKQKLNRIHKVISKVNMQLKIVGKEIGTPIKLTTYVARHSYTTTLKKSGVPISIIREYLGHSSERVTQIYLDNFDNEQHVVPSSIIKQGYPRPVAIDIIRSEDISFLWMTTALSSEKVKHFRQDPKTGVCIIHGGDSISLTGTILILTDYKNRKFFWKNYFTTYFPQGINDPEYCLLRFDFEEATLWIDGEFKHCKTK